MAAVRLGVASRHRRSSEGVILWKKKKCLNTYWTAIHIRLFLWTLIGKSLFECHNEASVEKIKQAVEKLKNHANEMYLGVTVDNQRFYLNPVRDEKGRLVGFFERFELNLQK